MNCESTTIESAVSFYGLRVILFFLFLFYFDDDALDNVNIHQSPSRMYHHMREKSGNKDINYMYRQDI